MKKSKQEGILLAEQLAAKTIYEGVAYYAVPLSPAIRQQINAEIHKAILYVKNSNTQ